MDYRDMGCRIRSLRTEKGLTQEQLAEMLGLSASFLGHMERGSRIASIDTLVALCRTLQVSPEYLLASGLEGVPLTTPPDLTPIQRRHLRELNQLVLRQMQEQSHSASTNTSP